MIQPVVPLAAAPLSREVAPTGRASVTGDPYRIDGDAYEGTLPLCARCRRHDPEVGSRYVPTLRRVLMVCGLVFVVSQGIIPSDPDDGPIGEDWKPLFRRAASSWTDFECEQVNWYMREVMAMTDDTLADWLDLRR